MIAKNVKMVLNNLPRDIELVVAAKTRSPEEILKAADAGVKNVGENYIQEALDVFKIIGRKVTWHFIGHLQKNKVKKAVEIFDMIQTVDSRNLAAEINKRCGNISKIMPVLIEINSARERQKFGVFPEEAVEIIKEISCFSNIKVRGLMTMGPRFGNPEESRPYFIETRKLFEKIKRINLPNIEMKYLSMGMSNSYRIAIEEGANMIRLGTVIFGKRKCEEV